MSRRIVINLVLSVVVGVLTLYLAFRNVPMAELQVAMQHFDPRWLIPGFVVSLLLQLFRAWRWQMELRPLEDIPLGRLWVITSIAYMAINLIPARLGEVVRPWLLSRRSTVSISNVVGNLVVEKTMDSLVLVFYILLGLLTASNLPDWVRRGAMVPAIGSAVLVTVVVLLYAKGEPFVDRWVVRYLPERFGASLKRVVKAIVEGMQILPNGRLLATVFLLSLGLWFLPILSIWAIMFAFDFTIPLSAALVVFIFIGFGTALPNPPGMIGPFQYACVLALGIYGVPKVDALAFGLVLNAVQLVSLVAQGVVALPLAGLSAEDLRGARGQLAS